MRSLRRFFAGWKGIRPPKARKAYWNQLVDTPTLKQRIAAVERKLAQEVDRREKTEALMRDLEAEAAAMKKNDDAALSKTSKSATSRVAEATKEAQKWKEKAMNDAHKLEDQSAIWNADLQHALEDVKHAKAMVW